ncbi:hypothetical protein O181_055368 [Austropuccinia psidii MF-1]|uniref:Integrase catalytic domain-containing protein n=1 Tax=Austropuccinia psidii MF-1 TaxID=1389203 RepID=A0A9Q3EB10_9BASI|nr:hypothetical protein [Austropuccinia psidii MF-1]
MDWVAGLPPGDDRGCHSLLVIVDRLSKTSISFPCHKDYTAMDTTLLIWNRVVSCTGIFSIIISDRDPKLNSQLWKNLHQLFGTILSFLTAYHPQNDGLDEIMIQTLEDMVRKICAYGLELKDCDGLPHDWCMLIPTKEISLRNKAPHNIYPVESSGTRKITKALRERKFMTKKVR